MRWAEIKVAASEESADLVANILIEEGCGGVAITGPSVRASETAELPADDPEPNETILTAYLPIDDRIEARLQTARDRIRSLPETGVDIGSGSIIVRPVEDEDWQNAWRSYFRPIKIGRIFVKPSWEDLPSDSAESIVVEIDPGMAFGTGNHPTTQLCLLALQKLISGGERVLDAGTGSGVLSIAAAKLGAGAVLATEIDTVAIEAAHRNIEHNGVANKVEVIRTESLADVEGAFDLAVANITADPIMAMAPDLSLRVRLGGRLIVSGIIEARADEVAEKLTAVGFKLTERSTDDEWVALVMERTAHELD